MNRALDEIRTRFDWGDRWGSTMGELFGIASALTVLSRVEDLLQIDNPISEPVPDDWEYNHGMIDYADVIENDITPDVDWVRSLESGDVTAIEAIAAGNVLIRYRDLLILRGFDY